MARARRRKEYLVLPWRHVDPPDGSCIHAIGSMNSPVMNQRITTHCLSFISLNQSLFMSRSGHFKTRAVVLKISIFLEKRISAGNDPRKIKQGPRYHLPAGRQEMEKERWIFPPLPGLSWCQRGDSNAGKPLFTPEKDFVCTGFAVRAASGEIPRVHMV